MIPAKTIHGSSKTNGAKQMDRHRWIAAKNLVGPSKEKGSSMPFPAPLTVLRLLVGAAVSRFRTCQFQHRGDILQLRSCDHETWSRAAAVIGLLQNHSSHCTNFLLWRLRSILAATMAMRSSSYSAMGKASRNKLAHTAA